MFKYKNNKVVSCLCGSVKLKAKGKLRHVVNCHCSQCVKTHGNFASYTSILEQDIKFISKKNLKWYKSSIKAKRGFCSKCGASIFYKIIKSKNISISAGLFQNPTNLTTKYNIFTEGKLDYYSLDNKIKNFKKYY